MDSSMIYNMIGLDVLNKVRKEVRSISFSPIPLDWWTDLSSWQDSRALHCIGNRLSVHTLVEDLDIDLEARENMDPYFDTIGENGNIEGEIS